MKAELRKSDSTTGRDNVIAMFDRWRGKLGYYSAFAALPALLISNSGETMAEDGRAWTLAESSTGACTKPELLRRSREYRFGRSRKNFDLLPQMISNDDCPGRSIPAGSYTSAAPYVDFGNTTDSNDTVTGLCQPYYCYYYDSAYGSDHVYTFQLTARGAEPKIEVSASSGSYKPLVYVVDSRFESTCPSGTGNLVQHWQQLAVAYAPAAGGTAMLNSDQMHHLPLNTDLYLFVDSEVSGPSGGAGPYTFRVQDVTIAGPAAPTRKRFDFDGDNRADVAVFRPGERTWYVSRSTQGLTVTQFGLSTDRIVPADYDGDGRTDIAIYRDGAWWRLNSSNGTVGVINFGLTTDIPVPADFNGDGVSELAVFRNGAWMIFDLALKQSRVVQFGQTGDKPVVTDYDGDGKADQAVYRNGEWHLNRSSQGYAVINFGLSSDLPVTGDYDGDGRADQAIYRNGEWHVNRSMLGYTVFNFGLATDVPVPADYDGDGRSDLAVFRDGIWYMLRSASGLSIKQFGLADDRPVPAAYVP